MTWGLVSLNSDLLSILISLLQHLTSVNLKSRSNLKHPQLWQVLPPWKPSGSGGNVPFLPGRNRGSSAEAVCSPLEYHKANIFYPLSLKRVAEKGSGVSHPVCRREMCSALTLLLRNDDLCPRLSNIRARNYSQRVSGSSGKSGPLQMLTQVSQHRGLIFQPDENVILWVSSWSS